MHFRILPIVILFLFVFVVAKVFDLALEKSTRNNFKIQSDIQASAEAKAKETKEAKEQTEAKDKKPDAKAEGDKSEKSDPAKKGDEEKKSDGKSEVKPGEDKEPGKTEGAAEPGVAQKGAPKTVEISDQLPMERSLLENLSKRRLELDDWANSIAMKESVLNATEKKISNKMEELKRLEAEVIALLAQYKVKEDEKTRKLVKIYEGMKPAEAAKIFDTIEMNILLEIVGGMKEDSASKIIAKMNTVKAKDLTTKLAEQRRLVSK